MAPHKVNYAPKHTHQAMAMTPRIQISSLANPRIKALIRLRRQKHRNETGLFIAEGTREIQRALDAGLTMDQWYHCPELAPPLAPAPGDVETGTPGAPRTPGALGTPNHPSPAPSPAPSTRGITDPPDLPDTRIFELSATVMGKVAYRQNPEGVLAVFGQPGYVAAGLGGLDKPAGQSSLWLIAMGLTKPGNLGAMVRTASAAGCTAMLIADAVVDPFNPNAIRASTGAVFSLPVICASASQIIDFLAHHRISVFAADPAATVPWSQVDLTGDVAIVIGAEHEGLSEPWRRCAAESGGQVIGIPMENGPVDSLNASSCAAVLLFEALRQRS